MCLDHDCGYQRLVRGLTLDPQYLLKQHQENYIIPNTEGGLSRLFYFVVFLYEAICCDKLSRALRVAGALRAVIQSEESPGNLESYPGIAGRTFGKMFGKEYENDTIVALSSPPGHSGVGLIRLSGPKAISIVGSLFKSRQLGHIELLDRRAHYGLLTEPESGRFVDDGIAVAMRGPNSYTGEDVVELSLHGSPVILQKAINLIISSGARLAQRGEFTRRAFLSGRLDLIQAEAVVDLIDSQTLAQADDARNRIDRKLSNDISVISSELKDIAAELEAFLDFDDDEEGERPGPVPALREVLNKTECLLNVSRLGKFRNKGLTAVITGKPNTGKSTLFNLLVGSERMITSAIPGTTRDPVSEKTYLNGVAITVADTAGVREQPELIEKEGIERTMKWLEESDMAIVVLDISEPIDGNDKAVIKSLGSKSKIFVLNKIDKKTDCEDPLLGEVPTDSVVRLSAKTGQGLDEFAVKLSSMAESIQGSSTFHEKGCLNDRALILMDAAHENIKNALEILAGIGPLEMVSFEIKAACDKIDEITGQKFTEDVLDRIFDRFCVGK